MTKFICSLLLLTTALACNKPRVVHIATDVDDAVYPFVLTPPSGLRPDFMVRQTITVTMREQDKGAPQTGSFDAVLQKSGASLLIIGLGPMNARAFTLEQKEKVITFEQNMGRALPVSPRSIVVDVHRVFFARLPLPSESNFTGTNTGSIHGEQVTETWNAGSLQQRTFTGSAMQFSQPIVVTFGEGCTVAACTPSYATLTNPWFSYDLRIENQDFEFLE